MFFNLIHTRIRFIFVGVVIILVLIIFKVFYIQVFQYEKLKTLSDSLYSRKLPIAADRGEILDRNGKVLATNITTTSLVLIPRQITDKKKVADALSKILGVTYEEMYKHVTKNESIERVHPEGRRLSYDIAKQIEDLGFDGVYLVKESKRYYPYNEMLSHVLGYIGIDNQGLSGLELVYDDYLKGEDEVYNLMNDKLILVKDGDVGKDLTLTIDINLQKYVESVLKEEIIKAKKNYSTKYFNHSYVVISDTYGGILAMSGKEYFNEKVIDRSIGVITDTMTVGSSVKAASMLIGYDTNTIKIGEVIRDECLKIKNTPKKCSFTTMGNINDIVALQRSSNVYQFKIAIELAGGIYRYNEPLRINEKAFETYREYFSRFGLGENTGIELLNESRGYKGSSTLPGLLLDFAIGQYDTYTTMQLNQYISTIARNGKRYSMHLLDNVTFNDEMVYSYEPNILNEINIEQKYIDRVVLGLRKVITNGTGYGYVNSKYKAAGKTGTSESFMDTNSDGYVDKETNSTSFVMFMPYDNPKVAISITSPNISYNSSYTYPLNKYVIRRITDKIDSFIN